MAGASETETPVVNYKRRVSIGSFVKTPLRTNDTRRFGPLGSVLRTPGYRATRHSDATPLTRHASLRGRTPALQKTPQRTEVEENNIKELKGKTWHVFRLTPLYNFRTAKSDFQMYARNLSSYIEAETKKGTFIDLDTNLPSAATVGMFSGLDVGPDDPKSLLIQVKGKSTNGKEDKVVNEALLLSTDLEYQPLKHDLLDHFTYFSTMLVHGPKVVAETIQTWLEVQFDCRVIPHTFTTNDLAFMAAMFTGFDEDHKPVELVYEVPSEVEGLSTINYSTKYDSCKRIWDCVRSSDEDMYTALEASQFIEALESHFYHCFKIKLNAMPLLTIGTPVAFVGKEGKIKFFTKSCDNLVKVCRHLTDLALDKLKICYL